MNLAILVLPVQTELVDKLQDMNVVPTLCMSSLAGEWLTRPLGVLQKTTEKNIRSQLGKVNMSFTFRTCRTSCSEVFQPIAASTALVFPASRQCFSGFILIYAVQCWGVERCKCRMKLLLDLSLSYKQLLTSATCLWVLWAASLKIACQWKAFPKCDFWPFAQNLSSLAA